MFELGVKEANRYLRKYDIKLVAEITNSSNVFTTSQRGKITKNWSFFVLIALFFYPSAKFGKTVFIGLSRC